MSLPSTRATLLRPTFKVWLIWRYVWRSVRAATMRARVAFLDGNRIRGKGFTQASFGHAERFPL